MDVGVGDSAAPVHPRTRGRRPGRWARVMLITLGVLFAALAVVGLGAHYITTAAHPVALGLTSVAPYLMAVGSVGALVLVLLARQWIGVALAVILLATVASTQIRLYIASPAPGEGRDLVVMTANLRLGEGNPADLVAAVRRDHVEILMVQELTVPELQALGRAGLDDLLGHRIVAPKAGGVGTGLWSRYPLTHAAALGDFTFETVRARVAVPGLIHKPTVVAMHMAGPIPDASYWQRDIALMPRFLSTLPGDAPVIIGGDFNATTDTPQFRRILTDGFGDAADQAGAGYPRTWPSNRWYPPVIAIDHVLTRDAVGLSVHTVEIPGSDHRALLTRIRVAASS